MSISLYGIFLRGQVGRYRNLFIDIPHQQASSPLSSTDSANAEPKPNDEPQSSILQNAGLMAAGLLVLVLIAESMGSLIETNVSSQLIGSE